MKPDPHGLAWDELALRFTAFSEGVSTCITGSTSIEHIKNNIRILEKGKLDDEIYEPIRSVFRKYDKDWNGLI